MGQFADCCLYCNNSGLLLDTEGAVMMPTYTDLSFSMTDTLMHICAISVLVWAEQAAQ